MESQFEELDDTVADVELKYGLWEGRRDWAEVTSDWGDMKFEDVDVGVMEDTVQKFWKTVMRADRGLPSNKVSRIPCHSTQIRSYHTSVK